MNKRFMVVLIVLAAAFLGLLIFNKNDSSSNANGGGNDNKTSPTNHTQGEGTTGVTLTEYGDFQCPACAQYYPLVKQIKAEYGDRITFQFRHFPLQTIHQNALISSRAAEAAGLQGKFFEMHDLLYENQQTWASSTDPTETFVSYARQLDLNEEKFRQDMKSTKTNRSVQADLALANKKGYGSTPTFEINGEKIENPRDLEGFKELIDEAISNSNSPSESEATN